MRLDWWEKWWWLALFGAMFIAVGVVAVWATLRPLGTERERCERYCARNGATCDSFGTEDRSGFTCAIPTGSGR